MQLTPKRLKGGQAFGIKFRHPITKTVHSFSLTTRDQIEADAICNDIVALFNDVTLLEDANSPRLLPYHVRAVEIVLGKAARERADERRVKPVLEEDDIGVLSSRVVELVRRSIERKKDPIEQVRIALKEYESRRYSDLFKHLQQSENHVKALRPLADEVERLRRVQNKHVAVTVAAAVQKWKEVYPDKVSPTTVQQAFTAVDSFLASLPNDFKLGDVKAGHIDEWLDGLRRFECERVCTFCKGVTRCRREAGADTWRCKQCKQVLVSPATPKGFREDDDKLSQVSKKRMRAYVSAFFTKAVRTYDLFENPIDKAESVAGTARTAEKIEAIRRLDEIGEFLNALKPFPYWRAWCAVAIFAGPRWAEQQWLKIDDVYLETNYIRITSRASGKRTVGTKTGLERNIPIEQTVLKKILADHVAFRRKEQRTGTTPAAKSQWLFPSAVGENPYKPREKTEPGLWSHGSVFLESWRAVAGKIVAGLKRPPAYWKFTPREWRHCYGTILGHCGWSELEISRKMGNSPEMCRRHYVADSGGVRWPFKWSADSQA